MNKINFIITIICQIIIIELLAVLPVFAQSSDNTKKINLQYECLYKLAVLKEAESKKMPAAKINKFRSEYRKELDNYNKFLKSYIKPKSQTLKSSTISFEANSYVPPSTVILKYSGPYGEDYSHTNTCGQYAINSILYYYGIVEEASVTSENTNPNGCFTAPDTIIKYLALNKIASDVKNNSSLNDIRYYIDSGKPVICYVAVKNIMHWVVIIGYEIDSSGSISSVYMRDAYWGSHSEYKMNSELFLKIWEEPIFQKIDFFKKNISYHYYMIAPLGANTADEVPTGVTCEETKLEDQISNGLATMAIAANQDVSWISKISSLSSLKKFDFSKVNMPMFISGAIQVLGALPQKIVSILKTNDLQSLVTIARDSFKISQGEFSSSRIMQNLGSGLKTLGSKLASIKI